MTSVRVKSDEVALQPQPGDVVVLRRVLLDVEVGLRDVRLGLVVVVVRDEVLDRVLREELAELVAELRGQRLVVRDDERGPLELLDRPGHGRRLPGAGGAEHGLELVAPLDALGELGDRLRLVCRRVVGVMGLESGGHRDRVAECLAAERCARGVPSASSNQVVEDPPQTSHVVRSDRAVSSPAVTTVCPPGANAGRAKHPVVAAEEE